MNLVNLERAAKAYHDKVLLDRVSLGVSAGQRIGVVGRNGAGKTTLLAALAGTADLDSGRATRARHITIGYLPQAEELTGTVGELVFGSLAEHEWAADPRRRAVVGALLGGVAEDADVRRLSGGERRRTALAALLLGGGQPMGSYDLLLLDEPTNHLDIEAISWLAGYLREHAQSYVVVTHDRWFLDAVTEETWEVAAGQVHAYDGGYSAYVLAKAERSRLAAAADQRRRNLLRKELAWLRRGPPARTSKPRFRIAAATALIAGEPPARDGVRLARLAAARLGKTVLELKDVSVAAGYRPLLDDVSWQLGPGERVGVLGANGAGKTSLLNMLAGVDPAGPAAGVAMAGVDSAGPAAGVATAAGAAGKAGPLRVSGQVVTGSTVQVGYLTQHTAALDPGLRALEAAEQVRSSARVGNRDLSASQLLDRLGLQGDRQWTQVGELSGGERRRLQLLLVLLAEPNVLLLDEPTNDLDVETLTELEDLLDGWPGSLVVVSHDRYFVERVTDHVLALTGGKLAYLPGGVDEYLGLVADGTARPSTGPAQPASARAGRVPAARLREGQKELSRLERKIARLSQTAEDLSGQLAASATDYERLIELGAQLKSVQDERAGLEERWLAVAEEISG